MAVRINITDMIDKYWGISAGSVRAQLRYAESRGESVDVMINSPGGSIFEGLEIYHEIKDFKGQKSVTVVGIAASMASIIALAGDKLRMAKGSMLMIHNPLTGIFGNAEDLRDTADTLDKLRDSLVAIYAGKTGKDEKEIKKMMDAETYMTASESIANKFADEEVDSISSPSMSMVAVMSIDDAKKKAKDIDWSAFRENLTDSEKNSILEKVNPKLHTGEPMKIDLNMLKTEAPELLAQIQEDARKSVDVAGVVATAKTDAVAKERERVTAILALNAPGREKLVAAAIANGEDHKDLALALLKANATAGATTAMAIDDEAGREPEVPPAKPADGSADSSDAKDYKETVAFLNKQNESK